ncbi:MAG: hypothetical protein WBQ25_14690 [Nitrososphaeraceae archaeon]
MKKKIQMSQDRVPKQRKSMPKVSLTNKIRDAITKDVNWGQL